MEWWPARPPARIALANYRGKDASWRSEEHTSELQSLTNLVCRLLLEKKKPKNTETINSNTNNENHASQILKLRTHAIHKTVILRWIATTPSENLMTPQTSDRATNSHT